MGGQLQAGACAQVLQELVVAVGQAQVGGGEQDRVQAAQGRIGQDRVEAAHCAARGVGTAGPVDTHQDVKGPVGRGALGGVGDDHGPKPLPQSLQLMAQNVDGGGVLGPGGGGDDIQGRAAGADPGVGHVQPEAAQGLAHVVPLVAAGGVGQKAVQGVAGEQSQLLGGVKGIDLGQKRNDEHAQRSRGVIVRATQEGPGGCGEPRVVVEARGQGAHQQRIVGSERPAGAGAAARPGIGRWCERVGSQPRRDQAEEVVDAVGCEKILGNAMAQFGPGGGQERGLLGRGQGEPGQGPVRGQVAGPHDRGDGHLGIDIAQQGPVATPGAILAAGLGSGQSDQGRRRARGGEAAAQVVDDDGPVGAQVVALVQDDRGRAGVDECVEPLARAGGQQRGDGVIIEFVDAGPDGGGARAQSARVGGGIVGGQGAEPGVGPGRGAPIAHQVVQPAAAGGRLPRGRAVHHRQRLVGQDGQVRGLLPGAGSAVGDRGRSAIGGAQEPGGLLRPLGADDGGGRQDQGAAPVAGGQGQAEHGLAGAGRGDQVEGRAVIGARAGQEVGLIAPQRGAQLPGGERALSGHGCGPLAVAPPLRSARGPRAGGR